MEGLPGLLYKPGSQRTVLGAPSLSSLTPEGSDIILWALQEPMLRAAKMHQATEGLTQKTVQRGLTGWPHTGLPWLRAELGVCLYLEVRNILPTVSGQRYLFSLTADNVQKMNGWMDR